MYVPVNRKEGVANKFNNSIINLHCHQNVHATTASLNDHYLVFGIIILFIS